MTSLLSLAIAMFAGLMMTRALKRLHLPDVTAYLVAGVLIGPCCIGALHIPGIGFASYDQLENIGLICDVALGFIAFSIGNEFRLSQLKETGRQAFIVGVIQAVVATLLVDASLLAFHFIKPEALTVPAAICGAGRRGGPGALFIGLLYCQGPGLRRGGCVHHCGQPHYRDFGLPAAGRAGRLWPDPH